MRICLCQVLEFLFSGLPSNVVFFLVVDFLLLAGSVETVFMSPVTPSACKLLEKHGATADEADLFPYLPHTMTVEPLDDYDEEYNHLDGIRQGVYYVISPKINLNRISRQINSPLTWTLDPYSLAKSDFGAHNIKMATFMRVFLDEKKRFIEHIGPSAGFALKFGRFFEDDYPLMLLGPLSSKNKHSCGVVLQVIPHVWIHCLIWHGECKRKMLDNQPDVGLADDFYAVVMEDDDEISTDVSHH